MKTLIMILSMIGMTAKPVKNDFSKEETRFIKNVTKMHRVEKLLKVSRLYTGRICIEYPTTAYILGFNGFIYQTWILEDGVWINLGPEC